MRFHLLRSRAIFHGILPFMDSIGLPEFDGPKGLGIDLQPPIPVGDLPVKGCDLL
jgi:hypothetical protein